MTRHLRLVRLVAFLVAFTLVLAIVGLFGFALGPGEMLIVLILVLLLTVVILRTLHSHLGRVR